MKKTIFPFLMVLIGISSLFNACNGQPAKTFTGNEAREMKGFEEMQRKSLQHQRPDRRYPVPEGLNFRYAASRSTAGVVHIKSVFPAGVGREAPDLFKDFFDEDFPRRFFPPESREPRRQLGSASGVIITSDGYIVSNNHVVNGAESIEVVLHDQRSYKAKVIGTDPATDLALLKIDEKKLPFIEFGNSDSLAVGDFVLAVGNPFNLASTVTAGIISAKARNINLLTDRWAVESYIQTDAAMNPGNSGGALVDINGRLIGITAAIASPTGAYAGYSFAIPIEIAKKTINDLLRYGKVKHGYLGIVISDMNVEKAKMLGIPETTGVIVDSLESNSPAISAGIRRKDVIEKVGNHPVETATQLRELIARAQPGEKLELTIIRAGKEKVIPVILMPVEALSKNAIASDAILKALGIEVSNLTSEEKNRLKLSGGVKIVSISPGKIAGQTGIRTGFIVTGVDGQPVNTTSDFIQKLQDKKGGVMLEGVYANRPGVYYYAFGL